METQNNTEKDFHAVEFMREKRNEMSKKYLEDKQQYLNDLKKAMEDFKQRQKEKYQSKWRNN